MTSDQPSPESFCSPYAQTKRRHAAVARSHVRALSLAAALLGSACEVSIETSSPLLPAFDPSIPDYVVRCSDEPVKLTVAGTKGQSARVNGQEVPVGSSTYVAVTSGQAFTLQVPLALGGRSSHTVRCLPDDFPRFTVERPGAPQAEYYIATPGLKAGGPIPADTSPQYVAIFDNRGVPLWWRKSLGATVPLGAQLLPNGNLAWLHYSGIAGGVGGGGEERRLDGSLVGTLNTLGGPADDHELLLLPNGSYVMGRTYLTTNVDLSRCQGPAAATVLDQEIQEIGPGGGLVWSWNARDQIPVEETTWPGICAATLADHDIYHFNSIEPDGDAYVISFRHLNAVYKISRSTGRIIWKLGGTPRPESLTVIGDPVSDGGGSLFGGQHDARRLPDGTWTVYDNRTGQPNGIPRALRFQIDEADMTATVVESVSDPEVVGSFCCGSARKLNTGNWVMAWGGGNPNISELSPEEQLVFRVNFTDGLFTYRTIPVAPGVLDRALLRAGMDAQYARAWSDD